MAFLTFAHNATFAKSHKCTSQTYFKYTLQDCLQDIGYARGQVGLVPAGGFPAAKQLPHQVEAAGGCQGAAQRHAEEDPQVR